MFQFYFCWTQFGIETCVDWFDKLLVYTPDEGVRHESMLANMVAVVVVVNQRSALVFVLPVPLPRLRDANAGH